MAKVTSSSSISATYVSLTGGPIWTNTTPTYPAQSVTWTSITGAGSTITFPGAPQYEEHECGIHDLKYKATRPGCPLCHAERRNEELAIQNTKLTNQLQIADKEIKNLQVNWDLLTAMRAAVDLVGEDDLAFFKTVLYQWRDEKSLGLKFTYGYDDNKKKKSVNGFIVLPRKGDPWGYACTSIGGLAIASYFEEACAARGSKEAMAILTRALSDHLPGSLDEPGHTPN